MSAEYFEARERALLGERYDTLYAAPQETAAHTISIPLTKRLKCQRTVLR